MRNLLAVTALILGENYAKRLCDGFRKFFSIENQNLSSGGCTKVFSGGSVEKQNSQVVQNLFQDPTRCESFNSESDNTNILFRNLINFGTFNSKSDIEKLVSESERDFFIAELFPKSDFL